MSVSDALIDEKAEPFLKFLLSGEPQESLERRENQRHPLSVTLLVQCLNDDLEPEGEPFRVMTRDVSAGGIGFVHAEPIEHRYLRVVMPDQKRTELLVEVQHCTAVGELGLLYLTGVRLRNDLLLDRGPASSDVTSRRSVDRTTKVPDPPRQ